ncbi:MAG: Hsp20/alpha crystallin family protein [Nitrospira sp.]|nr:Hsp20/alpha crystallin family protein [bacterium]MBL7049472.1 Hsp20/alpha crystallin family protein [Nitrospira sp.]
MSAERLSKNVNSSLEPIRHEGWLSPVSRMEDMFTDFFRRPLSRGMWPSMERLLEEVEPVPTVDIFEEKDSIVLKSDMPGISKEDIEISLTDDTITLSGEKKHEEKIEKKNYYRMERSSGSFCRTFNLPAEVQTDKAKASFKEGVLEIRIPKSESAKKKEQKLKID